MQISGIILAGGKSLRMGTDKAVLELKGQTLLEHAIEVCRPSCKTILISSNNSLHQKLGYITIPDEIPGCGPMGGIYSCLKQSETDWNFILSVDSPFVEPEFIQLLISQTGSFDVIVPVHAKGKEPLIAMYHKTCLAEIKKMLKSGNFKMHNLLNSINTKFVDVQKSVEKYPKLFLNLNRPVDL